MMKKLKYTLMALFGAVALNSCDLDEVYYSSVTPDTFITSPENTYAILSRPFTHWKWYIGADRWYLQELTSDEMTCPTRGSDFYNNGEYLRLQYHTWAPDDRFVENTYTGTVQGVARALEAYEDLAGVNYNSLGLNDAVKADHLNQLNSIMAYYYMRGLDFFGGMALYSSVNDAVTSRSTAQETFNFIEKLFKDAIPQLTKKEVLGASEDGYIKQAAAATLLAQLYFNSKSYTGVDRFADAAKICEDIIKGVYGKYDLDPTWYGPHSFDNDKSPEAIWNVPSENAKLEWNWYYRYFYSQQARDYFDVAFPASIYNGFCLTPSRESEGSPVYSDWKLGNTYEKFHDKDLRKKPYVYLGGKKYQGMFCVGLQTNPLTGKTVKGMKDKAGQDIVLKDYINVTGKESNMLAGSEDSGVRLVKAPIPNNADIQYLWNPDCPVIRLTEVYYMLAECYWRDGRKSEAADLINKVRARNFQGGVDPDPVPDNFDIYRLADEWMIEFLGEGRRRTDLIRLGLWETESWWDHQPSDATKRLFPLPSTAIAGNPLLTQNPGY
ncbi:MAG: RagB/SusD family nutrient uptake outer membrane protein [Muribaculum sp.]|nr:RagB/SusD family nutrient uptake outer membrane protein [Muribaculum sp.]